MDTYSERVNQDVFKIRELSRITNNRVRITSMSGNPINHLELELHYVTVSSANYPNQKQAISKLSIDLLSNYPISKPKVKFNTPVFHPNVYPSNDLCIGTWTVIEFLDLLVKRIIKIITFDPSVIDLYPPANGAASRWYQQMIQTHPEIFPTEDLSNAFIAKENRPSIRWRDI